MSLRRLLPELSKIRLRECRRFLSTGGGGGGLGSTSSSSEQADRRKPNGKAQENSGENHVLHIPLLDRVTEKRRKAVHMLVTNFAAPKLASAVLEREVALAKCAALMDEGRHEELYSVLESFRLQDLGNTQSTNGHISFDTPATLSAAHRESLSKHLNRLPREYSGMWRPRERRASVLLPLCHHAGEPSIIFTRRSAMVNKHPGDICFPGGMVDLEDRSVEAAALRELEEEVGVPKSDVEVLGVLRCDWAELTAVTGVAVTPVIGFIDMDLSESTLNINPSEVAAAFAVSLSDLADSKYWTRLPYHTPVFEKGSHVIWGLTAYILDRFMRKALRRTMGPDPGVIESEVRSLVRSEIVRQVHHVGVDGSSSAEPDHGGRWTRFVHLRGKS